MIGISKLYCGNVESSDPLRYGRDSQRLPSHLLQFSEDKKPVIVWNVTRRCNLKCLHCYAQAEKENGHDEISTTKAREIIQDLADFGVPVILFSGGEPLVRKDIFELAELAVSKGMRAVISTNGTLIDRSTARKLKSIGLSYVGISLDGGESVHDRFRGVPGTFQKAMQGLGNCQREDLKVGLRFTIYKDNFQEIPKLFHLIKEREIPRVCFYHLVYAGRGTTLINKDLDHLQTRNVMDQILEKTKDLFLTEKPKEVLTVDNHADGPYLYLRLLQENPNRAQEVMKLLQFNQGNNSGRGIGCISWDGKVHADQFWRNHVFGNVLEKPFSNIWNDPKIDLLAKLKDKKKYIHGRCSDCRFLDVCAGNFRARAEAYHGDIWAPDPACYLTDQEIGLKPN